MNSIKALTTAAAMLAISFGASPAFADTVYTQSVTSVSGVTIPGTTHNLGCALFAVSVYDNSIPAIRQSASAYSWSINQTTYDATVTFNNTPFSGTVYLTGCFSTSSGADDFLVARFAPSPTHLLMCFSCTYSSYADRTYMSKDYVSLQGFSASTNGDGQSGTVWVWIDSNTMQVVFGTSVSSGGITSATGTVQYSVSGYPSSGVVPLGHSTFNTSGVFAIPTDDRPSGF
jgi:hypothetical protein